MRWIGRWIRRMVCMLLMVGAVLGGIVLGLGYARYKEVTMEITIQEKVAQIQAEPGYTSISEIEEQFLDAIVAVEDHRFYQHQGVDPISILRATLTNIDAKDIVQGGSTITQQVGKNMYFSHRTSFTRKVAELFIANALERNYTKGTILELYVNIIYYGDNNYGIGAAAKQYFSKPPSELTFEEATLLAGLPQAPSAYALSSHYDRALRRQQEVIAAYHKYQQKVARGRVNNMH